MRMIRTRPVMSLMNLALAGVAVATVLSLFARHGWVPELMTHFRLQYVVTLLALAAGYLMARRRVPALLALAALLPNAWYAAPYVVPAIVPESIAAPAGRDVSIVSLNLLIRNRDYAEVREYLQRSDADVLVLSELTPEWVRELRNVTADYPYWLALDRQSAWGLGVYSRYPLEHAETNDFGSAGSVNVVANLVLPGGRVQLAGVHLASPTRPDRATARNRQLTLLAQRLGPPRRAGDGERLPRLLVGDMNLTPFSPYFGDLIERTGLVDARRSSGNLGTWPTWIPPLRIPIDHCLADPDLPVARVTRGPIVGSDHYPLEITLRQRG